MRNLTVNCTGSLRSRGSIRARHSARGLSNVAADGRDQVVRLRAM